MDLMAIEQELEEIDEMLGINSEELDKALADTPMELHHTLIPLVVWN